MERNYQTPTSTAIHSGELDWRTAFHEAGHAASIYIGNQQKQLPPVFFEIQIKRPQSRNGHFFAKILDGNLIQNMPIGIVESYSAAYGCDQHSYQRAYEADVLNLLAGPLAEAKYVSIRDNEVLNLKLINFQALYNYGGLSDLEKVMAYLDCFIASKALREEKVRELLTQAYQFIDNPLHWRCILNLADYILNSHQETISCEEAINLFDHSLCMPASR